MLYKFVIVFAFFMVLADCNPLQSRTSSVEHIIEIEEPCIRQGGLCLKEDMCDPSNVVTMGVILCPLQMNKGVVCCYQ